MARFVNETGTGPIGMEKGARIQVTAVITPITASWRTENFCFSEVGGVTLFDVIHSCSFLLLSYKKYICIINRIPTNVNYKNKMVNIWRKYLQRMAYDKSFGKRYYEYPLLACFCSGIILKSMYNLTKKRRKRYVSVYRGLPYRHPGN